MCFSQAGEIEIFRCSKSAPFWIIISEIDDVTNHCGPRGVDGIPVTCFSQAGYTPIRSWTHFTNLRLLLVLSHHMTFLFHSFSHFCLFFRHTESWQARVGQPHQPNQVWPERRRAGADAGWTLGETGRKCACVGRATFLLRSTLGERNPNLGLSNLGFHGDDGDTSHVVSPGARNRDFWSGGCAVQNLSHFD